MSNILEQSLNYPFLKEQAEKKARLLAEEAEKKAKWLAEEVDRTKKIPEHCDINGVKHWTVWGAALFIAQRKYKDDEAREKAISKYFPELQQSIKQGALRCFDEYGDLLPESGMPEYANAIGTDDFKGWVTASRYQSLLKKLEIVDSGKIAAVNDKQINKKPTGKAQLLVEACLLGFQEKNGGHPSSAAQLIAFSVQNNPSGYEGLKDSGGSNRGRIISFPSSRDPAIRDRVQWQSFSKAYKWLTNA